MPSRTAFVYPPSNLTSGRFLVRDDLEVVCVHTPELAVVERADAEWIPARRPTDIDWRWRDRLIASRDMFAVTVRSSGQPVALLHTTAPRLLRLPNGPAYRLDFVEVGSTFRGADVGFFTMVVAASRALECGAKKLVLAAVPEARKLYDRSGGTQVLAQGWKVPRGLLAYEFPEETLLLLAEALNERRQD